MQDVVDKPVLEDIPAIDGSLLNDEAQRQVAAALAAYNRNLLRLIIYAIDLGGYADVSVEYKDRVIEILNGSAGSSP